MKTKIRFFCTALILIAGLFTACASNKTGTSQDLNDEDFSPKLILIASGNQRLVKFDIDKNAILPDVDTKNIKSAKIKIDFYSGRKPTDGSKENAPVASITFDLLKDADKLINGYDLIANAKALKTTAADLNKAFSEARYYYAKGSFEASVKEGTKTKTIYSNDTVYTPLEDVPETKSYVDEK